MSAPTRRVEIARRSGPERPALSVIVPAYNESQRIGDSLERICGYLAARGAPAEVVLVDDGSEDGTFEQVVALARDAPVPVRVVRYERNRGKGFALKVGFAQSRGERLLFTDADLSVPIEHADELLAALDAGADAAIGSRHIWGAEIVAPQPLLRRVLGAVFTLLVRAAIAPVYDATCGFKAFRGDVGRRAFAHARLYDWSYDAEILHLLHRMGHKLVEVPVHWEHRAGTKVRPLRDGIRAFAGLVRIRLGTLRGVYQEENRVEPTLQVWESLSSARVEAGE